MKELEERITALKERGATHFRKQAYKEAIKQFSEGINLFQNAGEPMHNEELKLKVTHLYTNRCLCFHSLNQQASALADANYVLKNLDTANAKALYRRAHALKSQNKWEEAMKDYQTLFVENKTDDIKKNISECLMKAAEARKKQME